MPVYQSELWVVTAIAMPAMKQTPATASAIPASRSWCAADAGRDETEEEGGDRDDERVVSEREQGEEERRRGEQPGDQVDGRPLGVAPRSVPFVLTR